MPVRSRSRPSGKKATGNDEDQSPSKSQLVAWKKMFEEIDSDKSGAIDLNELMHAMSAAYPNLQLTYSDVSAMLDEADTNHDGELDLDEFIHIMGTAHDKNNLWSKVGDGMLSTFQKNTASFGKAIESTTSILTAPMRLVTSNYVYLATVNGVTHHRIGAGMRIMAEFFVNSIYLILLYNFVTIIVKRLDENRTLFHKCDNHYDVFCHHNIVFEKVIPSLFQSFIPLGVCILGSFLSFVGLFYGKSLPGMIFGFKYTDNYGKTLNFFHMVGANIFGLSLYFIDFWVLLLTDRTLSQKILDYEVVLDE